MTRFDLDMDGSMEPSEHGRWVRYEDAQAREPLKDEQIIKMRKELNPVHGQVFNSLEFARAIEAAHGIVEKK